jgi:hypothetical protein
MADVLIIGSGDSIVSVLIMVKVVRQDGGGKLISLPLSCGCGELLKPTSLFSREIRQRGCARPKGV